MLRKVNHNSEVFNKLANKNKKNKKAKFLWLDLNLFFL
jgi:hypothetical protein